jgi:uncharacterized membrane protein
MKKNTAAALTYALGWVTGLIFFLTSKDPLVRFHALQSIVVFGGLTVISMIPLIGWMLSPFLMIVGFILWLVLIFKAYRGGEFKLPWVSNWVKDKLKVIK